MEKQLYRAAIGSATTLSLISAILLFAGLQRAGLGLLGLTIAALPLLMHLQTRQLGSMLKYRFGHLDKKLKSAGISSTPSPGGNDSVEIRAAQREISAHVAKLETLMQQSSSTQQSVHANELRRESRMLRLTAAQLADELRAVADK